jgi:hypothetical protein
MAFRLPLTYGEDVATLVVPPVDQQDGLGAATVWVSSIYEAVAVVINAIGTVFGRPKAFLTS